jgi:uncharacterized SAM-binding protein YcdF (DUF218 family)
MEDSKLSITSSGFTVKSEIIRQRFIMRYQMVRMATHANHTRTTCRAGMTTTDRFYLGKTRTFLRVPLVIGLSVVCLFSTVALQIALFGEQHAQVSADVAIVLGAAAWGSRPSPVYRERINEAVLLYKRGRVQGIIFTGGTRKIGFPTEAEVGRQFAVQNGVPTGAIRTDPKSRTTIENLTNAQALMRAAAIHSALLVSDPLHMKRSMAIATDLGIQAAPAPTESSRYRTWSPWGKFLWRETWLYLEYVLLGKKLVGFIESSET